MKLAFSTLSSPAWTLEHVVEAAVEYGYDGVEIRGIGPDVDLRRAPDFAPARLPDVRARFADRGVAICCLGASARFADPADRAAGADETRAYIEMAAALGCPNVRVFGGAIPQGQSRSDTAHAIAEALNALAPFARQYGVGIVLETHDDFSKGAHVAEVMQGAETDVIGVVWDLFHPYHHGEPAIESDRLLHPYVRHVHVKDGVGESYGPLGEGEVPIAEMLGLLLAPTSGAPLDPFVSVEWEKRWIPDLAEPEVILPQYAATLRAYERKIVDRE